MFFCVRPVFGPWYFFVRRQGRDFAKNTGFSSIVCVFFYVFGVALYMLKINQAFFVKPVFGPWYFFVRRQSRDFA